MVPSPAPLQTNLAFWKNAVLWPDHHVQSHPTEEVGGTWPQPATAALSLGGNYVEPPHASGKCTLDWTQSFGTETLGRR